MVRDRQFPYFAIIAGVAFVCSLGGYFNGREHMKYEMRAALRGVFEGPSGNASQPTPAAPPPRAEPASAPRVAPAPQPIRAALVTKGFEAMDISAGVPESTITLALSFENLSGKDVRAFDGVLYFNDLLDNLILSTKIAVNDPLKSGAKTLWQGGITYNQFMERDQAFRGAETPNIKTVFLIRKILFADGASQEFSTK
jgi:hypothetical protein